MSRRRLGRRKMRGSVVCIVDLLFTGERESKTGPSTRGKRAGETSGGIDGVKRDAKGK